MSCTIGDQSSAPHDHKSLHNEDNPTGLVVVVQAASEQGSTENVGGKQSPLSKQETVVADSSSNANDVNADRTHTPTKAQQPSEENETTAQAPEDSDKPQSIDNEGKPQEAAKETPAKDEETPAAEEQTTPAADEGSQCL